MEQLFKFDLSAFNLSVGIKATLGLLIILLLGSVTGQPWILTGLVALFAWLTTLPGSLGHRLGGIAAFGAGAAVLSLITGQIGLDLTANLVLIALVGFVGTVVLGLGVRAYMVGYVLICWMIYSPFLIEGTGAQNALLAILAGCGVMAIMAILPDWFGKGEEPDPTDNDTPNNDWRFASLFALTIAIVLVIGTYLGWTGFETDPTLVVGGAFFIIGFDANKTWVAGIARVIGILLGTYLGFALAQTTDNAAIIQFLAFLAVFLAFAAGGVHPGAFMFFFLVALSIGWASLEPAVLELTVNERLWGETAGVVLAMIAIAVFKVLRSTQERTE